MITPLILSWADGGAVPYRKVRFMSFLEAGGLFLALFALCLTVFNRSSNWRRHRAALRAAPAPPVGGDSVQGPGRGDCDRDGYLCRHLGSDPRSGPIRGKLGQGKRFSCPALCHFHVSPVALLAALMEERDEAKETLLEREERIQLAAETAHLALWTIDFHRGRSWMNDKGAISLALGITNRSRAKCSFPVSIPRIAKESTSAIEQARTQAKTFEIEFRLLRGDGTTRWLISRGRYLSNSLGEVSELLGVAIDVTDQVKASLELRSRQEELARLSRVTVMGELTASLAHELNQPLTAIASNAAAGKRFLAGGQIDPKFFHELLEDVFQMPAVQGAVIQGIRQLVRKGEEARVSLGLNEVVGDVLRLLRSNLLSRATRIETELDANLPIVWADPVHMQQVLINLVVNSLEAMEETPVEKRKLIISTDGTGEVGAGGRPRFRNRPASEGSR